MESRWSDGQIELFHALGKICERVGREGAEELVREGSSGGPLNGLDGRGFAKELRELRQRAGLVDDLEKLNKRLSADLDAARGNLLGADSVETIVKVGNGVEEVASRSLGMQTISSGPDEDDIDWKTSHERLLKKHNVLTGGYQDLMLARDKLESKLRSSQKSNREWVEYANGLEKKIGRLEGKLTSHGIPLKRRSVGSSFENTPQILPTSSHELVPVQAGEAGPEPFRYDLPNLRHMSERISELAKNPTTEKPAYKSPYPPLCSSTEEDIGVLQNLSNQEQVDAAPIIKAEPLSDTPIVTSYRSVKKRKGGSRAGSNESGAYAKVKVEIITSSPIGLAGFQSLFPQESMDLDDIGEKMNTPKKRRQAVPNAHFENSTIAESRLPVQLVQDGQLQQGESNSQQKGIPSALQSASPNKRILPRTTGKERESKRRHLGDRMGGVVIFGEDGENDVATKIGPETDIQTEDIHKLPRNAAQLQWHLTGLLEKPSPAKEVLTPSRPLIFSAATAQIRARATPAHKRDGLTPLARRQVGTGRMTNAFTTSRETPRTDHKHSAAKKRAARTPRNSGAFESENSDQEPLRARKVHRLSLEHFKINPQFNQGSDYAFTDVVRGRQLRKCLPGCTKPECCGDKFRKFVEFARAHEEQTVSQDEEDAKLLDEYLGDNRSRLENITQNEKEELLIQARTRSLANKASKHRHAYERRRSPPGFWRSDFPSTQELQTDRQEAASREREMVQQRYQEAMRPGGRWLFRDE